MKEVRTKGDQYNLKALRAKLHQIVTRFPENRTVDFIFDDQVKLKDMIAIMDLCSELGLDDQRIDGPVMNTYLVFLHVSCLGEIISDRDLICSMTPTVRWLWVASRY